MKLKKSFGLRVLIAVISALALVVAMFSAFAVYRCESYGMYSKSYEEWFNDTLEALVYSELEPVYRVAKMMNSDDAVPEVSANIHYEILLYNNLRIRNFTTLSECEAESHHNMTIHFNEKVEKERAIVYVEREPFVYDEIGTAVIALRLYDYRYAFVAALGISLFVAILCYVLTIVSAGYGKNGERTVSWFDRIPIEMLIIPYTVFLFFELAAIGELEPLSSVYYTAILPVILFWNSIVISAITGTVSSRIKNRVFSSTSFICLLICRISVVCKAVVKDLPSIAVSIVLVILAVPAVAVPLTYFAVMMSRNVLWTVLYVILWIVIAVTVVYFVWNFFCISKGAAKMAEGELDHRIPTDNLVAPYKNCAENMNKIGDATESAIEAKLKGERFKTELITNVSHDIKTPITSIINYVDLLKKLGLENRTANEYIEVLDRQSQRLKKLTGDLVDVSKASSGTIEVNRTRLELGVFITQAAGEYAERLEAAGIQLIPSIPENEVTVFADGKLMWRVFDNLLSNVCKYALRGTRAYLKLNEADGKAVMILSNISRDPINISGEELMERFVRGDASRHTEGSGLGLSIAKSLMLLQGGELLINTDYDLYKAQISINTVSENEKIETEKPE